MAQILMSRPGVFCEHTVEQNATVDGGIPLRGRGGGADLAGFKGEERGGEWGREKSGREEEEGDV